MNGQRFDNFARRLASEAGGDISRRSILRALGLGAAVAGARALTPAATRTVAAQVQPSGPTDPIIAAKALELEYDVERIFSFVRDEVDYDPYAGVLRGARGTLWGLAGNAADQTLLLAALLETALVQTRFVVGELSEQAAAQLLATSRLDAQTARERAARVFLPVPKGDEAVVPVPEDPVAPTPEPEVEQLKRELPGFAQRTQDAIDRRLAEGVATVTEALAGAGIELPEPEPVLPDRERRQHVWLQYAAGPNWIDLDPTLPNTEPGEVHAAVTATLDALPDELVHRISFRLVAEKVSWGVPAREELLTFEAASSELVGVPITFLHPQAEALAAVGESIGGAISGYRNFMPLMIVGEETVSGTPVTFAIGEGALDVLGDGAAVDGDTLAEWLEIEVSTPDGVSTIVREVFDRVGPEQRAIGPVDPKTVPPVELVVAGEPATSYLPLAGLWSIAVVTGAIPDDSFNRDPAAELGFADLVGIANAYHFAHSIFSLRDTVQTGHRVYLDEPNLTAFVLRPTAVTADGQVATTGLDLLHRSLAAVPLAGVASRTHPLLAAGVLSHAIEQTIVEVGGEPPLNQPVQVVSGVSRVFEEAQRQGVATVVLQPTDANTAMPAVGEAARRRIGEALAAGYVVIVPERSVALAGVDRSGWWLFDPTTGVTLDQMDDGGGTVSVEIIVLWTMVCLAAFALIVMMVGYAVQMASFAMIPSVMENSAYEDDAAEAAAARAAAAQRAARKGAASATGGAGAVAICALAL
jgi:transglutaminase-like putative cysteine protease